jgi:hypothetical protein
MYTAHIKERGHTLEESYIILNTRKLCCHHHITIAISIAHTGGSEIKVLKACSSRQP